MGMDVRRRCAMCDVMTDDDDDEEEGHRRVPLGEFGE